MILNTVVSSVQDPELIAILNGQIAVETQHILLEYLLKRQLLAQLAKYLILMKI